VVSKPVVNMYSSASSDGDVASQALYGTGVLALEKQGEWTRVRTGDGYTGWVAAADITSLDHDHAQLAPSAGTDEADILRELVHAGVAVRSFATSRTSLEEIFLKVYGQSDLVGA